MILNLSEHQSEFLEELLFNKYKEIELERTTKLYQLNYIAKEYSIDFIKQDIKELDNYLDNIKSILEVMESNNKTESSNDDIQEYDRAWDDLYDDDRYEDYNIDDEDVK